MIEDPLAAGGRRTPESYRQQIANALDHAGDLIVAAERVLADDLGYPNIAYHLGILALEEIGRAGILSQVMVAGRIGAGRMEQRLDDHVFKLMHAVWAPALDSGKLDPKKFEEARAFAQSTHARRMAGLYTDHNPDDGTSAPPRDSVLLGHATSIIGLAKANLEMRRAHGIPSGETTEELEWYLDTVSNEDGRKRLFSRAFITKHEELEGDTRAWVAWAKAEFERIAAEEQALLQRELAREISNTDRAEPKWAMKIRFYTASHSIRPAALNYWNKRIEGVKFYPVSGRKHELLMEMTLGDRIALDGVFDAGLSLSKMFIIALNVGAGGFFWYELTTQAQTYYESLREISGKHAIIVGRNRGLPKEWSDPEGKKQYVALEDSHMENAIRFLAAFAMLPEAATIFGPYLQGMALLAKSDLHLSYDAQAKRDFTEVLRGALRLFGDWDGEDETFTSSLHKAFEPVMPEDHRLILFEHLTRAEATADQQMADAVNTKRIADVYLTIVAHRLWPEFVRRAGDSKSTPIV